MCKCVCVKEREESRTIDLARFFDIILKFRYFIVDFLFVNTF